MPLLPSFIRRPEMIGFCIVEMRRKKGLGRGFGLFHSIGFPVVLENLVDLDALYIQLIQ